MNLAKPLLWHQGQFLQPHHFQLYDLYVQSLSTPLRSYLHPFFWGVCRMEIFEPALQNFSFELARSEFIFQDGAWTVYPGNCLIAPRSFKADWKDLEKPFMVYAGLRQWNRDGENVAIVENTQDLKGITARMVAPINAEPIKDQHQGSSAGQVRLMDHVVRLFWESEIKELGNYHLLPLARLEYEQGRVRASNRFIPPAVTVSAVFSLQEILRAIRESVVSRCHHLEEYKSPKEYLNAEAEPHYLVYLLALRSINRYLPYLCHQLESPVLHPWDCYGLLRQMVGELSIFTERVDALGRLADGTALVPEYDHENLGYCFGQIQTLLDELLNSILVGPESIINLNRREDFFTADIPTALFSIQNSFYLVVRASGNRDEILRTLQQIAKVSSAGQVQVLISRALPGLSLEYCATPPPGLPKRPDSYYFRLSQTHRQWQEIQQSQSFCLYWDNAPEDSKVEIVVLRK
jgi:type VI secretion system protein ImpJ